ncbi:MAG: hypothetical protein ACSLFL_07360, partial [Alphaproteobacteria bacterium]
MLIFAISPVWAKDASEDLALKSYGLFSESGEERQAALDALVSSGRADAAPILILAMRLTSGDAAALSKGLKKLTGADPGDSWGDWFLWQEAHPETGVLPGFSKLQSRVYSLIDPNFDVFLPGDQKHEIRLEEITWGGVVKDAIPALTSPPMIEAAAAAYL